jgi:hypothetical protein
MNRLIQILFFILMLLIFGAPSCVDEEHIAQQEQNALNEAREDIRDEFETEYLSEASLYAYENTAKQKLSDLADYMRIMTNTTLDFSFRQKAGEMIQNLFRSENVILQLELQDIEPLNEVEVHRIVKKGLGNQPIIQPFFFENIQIRKPLRRNNESTYTGVITFSQQFLDPTNPDQVIQSIQRTAHFYVVKENKTFGAELLNIWSVRIGEIK